MSVREHLEAAWKASLLEPYDETTAHIIWSIGRHLGPDEMTRLTEQAMRRVGTELAVERLEAIADSQQLRVEVYETVAARNVGEDRIDGLEIVEMYQQYRWRVRHSNGEVMASGEGYVDKRDRDHAVKVLHPDLDVVEVEG